jgi:anti-sigma B factor antagonist
MTSARIDATGEIDATTAPGLRTSVYEAVDANPGAIVTVDLSGVEFLDSTGLGVLVGALKHARTGGGDIALTGAQPHVWKVFQITGLDKVFTAQAPG